MAELIATPKPSVNVPDLILRLLRSAIDLRRRCSSWFQKNAMQEDQLRRSTETHAHFIDVLEDGLQILESNSLPSKDKNDIGDAMERLSVSKAVPSHAENPENRYDLLFIDDDLSDEPVSTPEPSADPCWLSRRDSKST